MKRFTNLGSLPMGSGPRCVAIGVFDGVHLGHQEVIRRAVESARRRTATSMVITFSPNPLAVLRPELKITQLTNAATRADRIGRLGVDELLEISFTAAFSKIPWERFCEVLMGPPINGVAISVGKNFRFGHGGEGTAAMLRDYARGRGIEVEIPDLVTSPDRKPISSTRIRRLIAQGEVGEVIALLGRPHVLSGTVVHGDGRGASLGIPTANVDVGEHMAVPAKGVYAAKVLVDGTWWASALNVGHAPTFREDGELRLEAFLLDYAGPAIYDASVTIAFLARLRAEQRFDGPEQLIAQITSDIERARQICAGSPDPL